MRIKSLEYFNKALELKLEHIEFKNLTLLVGASGVGKSQILKAILDLRKIATGSQRSSVGCRIFYA
jgi:ABC-type nitrate/sulfonate/bicarbonate transport system ATPase subunit